MNGKPPPALDGLRLQVLRGAAMRSQLDALAALRIAVFRDWPYLYAGSRDYEARYLDAYARSPNSQAILLWDGDTCVGASTVVPLREAALDVQQPFLHGRWPLAAIDYFGESILLPAYRGRGLGVHFFALREAHARELGLGICAFCAVQRPTEHPSRPPDDVGNDAFWRRRGYAPAPEIVTYFDWTDIGDTAPSRKPMQFWLKTLGAAQTDAARGDRDRAQQTRL